MIKELLSMPVPSLILLFLAAIGITHIITSGSIFGPIRKFFLKSKLSLFESIGKVLMCNQCVGFWVGTIFFFPFLISYFFVNNFGLIPSLIFAVFFGFFIFGPINSLLSDIVYRFKVYLCKDCG